MDKSYWLGRKRSAQAMARRATTAESRLIHYDLAGRYSIKAAMCVPLPFMIPPTAPSGEGERAALKHRSALLDPRKADPDMADELVRKDLGLVRPDEVIVTLED